VLAPHAEQVGQQKPHGLGGVPVALMLGGDRETYVALAGIIGMRHGGAVADQLPARTQRHRELEPFPGRIGMLMRDLPDKTLTLVQRIRSVPALKASHLLRRAVRHKRGHIIGMKPAQRHARPGQLGEAFIGHNIPSRITLRYHMTVPARGGRRRRSESGYEVRRDRTAPGAAQALTGAAPATFTPISG
jgi:hypothetical protein